MTVELYALPLGTCQCRFQTPTGRTIHADLPVSGYLLRLSDDKLALIDTGMNRLHVDDPDLTWRDTPRAGQLRALMSPEDSLLYRLAQLDVGPADIDYVINTHLHFDHAGNNDLLGSATFFVQRDQYVHALDNPRYPSQYWNLPALKYELVDGESELFDAVRVIPTPGHAPGHQSVEVTLPEGGSMIICGDAVVQADDYRLDDWSHQEDPVLARQSALHLRDLATESASTVFYGHDPEQLATMKWSPESAYR
jgi:N-acyl homoserine lactone hydrolase